MQSIATSRWYSSLYRSSGRSWKISQILFCVSSAVSMLELSCKDPSRTRFTRTGYCFVTVPKKGKKTEPECRNLMCFPSRPIGLRRGNLVELLTPYLRPDLANSALVSACATGSLPGGESIVHVDGKEEPSWHVSFKRLSSLHEQLLVLIQAWTISVFPCTSYLQRSSSGQCSLVYPSKRKLDLLSYRYYCRRGSSAH